MGIEWGERGGPAWGRGERSWIKCPEVGLSVRKGDNEVVGGCADPASLGASVFAGSYAGQVAGQAGEAGTSETGLTVRDLDADEIWGGFGQNGVAPLSGRRNPLRQNPAC